MWMRRGRRQEVQKLRRAGENGFIIMEIKVAGRNREITINIFR